MKTTVGQLLINRGLPEGLRDYNRVLDKKSTQELLDEVAKRYPDRYSQVLKHLMDVGRSAASTKGVSISLRHLLPSRAKSEIVGRLQRENQADIDNDELNDDERDARIINRTARKYDKLLQAVLQEGQEQKSPFELQVRSGGRGNPGQLNSLVGADLIVNDYANNPLPVPIVNSYADGLDPVEYWAAAYGARKGLVDVKLATSEAGFLGKQLALAAQRQMVTDEAPKATRLPVGVVVESDDNENIGAVLAHDVGEFKAGTVITPKILESLRNMRSKILIHSPMTSLAEGGGIDRLSAGSRERGRLSAIGDPVGITAAQAISEPISQGSLDSKHRSGVGGDKIKRSGFEYLNRLLQAPEFFAESGPLSPVDGRVKDVVTAPQGGHFIHVGDQKVYVNPNVSPTVKPGQKVEVGDNLTDGVPHPRDLVRYLGVGEGRRRFLGSLMEAFKNSNLNIKRRNAEAVVAGLINHMRVTDIDGVGDHIVDDVVPYNTLVTGYNPREGSQQLAIKRAKGKFLEEPVLHYGPGTRVTSRVLQDLKDFDVQDVVVHDTEPQYEPHFERLMTSTSLDPDWQTQLAGFYTGRSFQKAVQRGSVSDTDSTSYVPSLAKGTTFGKALGGKGRY